MQNTEFTTTNNVLSGFKKFLRRAGHDKTEHHARITNKDLVVLRKLEAMNPNTPRLDLIFPHRTLSLQCHGLSG